MAAILCVDDESAVCALLDRILRDLGHTPILASGVTEAQQALSQQTVDLLMVDCVMPGRNGFELFDYVREEGLDVPIVAMSGYSTAEHAEIATNRGAIDFLSKPLRLESIRIAVRSALALHRLRRLSEETRRELSALRGPSAVVGTSEPIREVLEAIDIVAPSSSPVLLHGEAGTGKSLFAREIHARSPRYDQPFVVVNCATLSEPLLGAMLFGTSARGSGAPATELGAFQRAAHGTIVLDEIADLRLHDQAKLLRVIQGHELEREGAHPLRVDGRVIATTRQDLGVEVQAGRFHSELHQKLSGAGVRTPPLRECLDDIPLLVTHFVELNAAKLAVKVPHIQPAAVDYLRRRPWPGNVRELANAVERAMIQQPNAPLTPEAFGRSHGPGDAVGPAAAGGVLSMSPSAAAASGDVLDLRTLERIAIYRALQKTGGHKTKAAELLGINERTLRNKLKAEPMPVWVSTSSPDPPPGR